MTRPVWHSVHTNIDGLIIDRDRCYPDLELSMVPMGRALPREEQTRRLRIQIDDKTITVLGEESIVRLRAFLDERP